MIGKIVDASPSDKLAPLISVNWKKIWAEIAPTERLVKVWVIEIPQKPRVFIASLGLKSYWRELYVVTFKFLLLTIFF